MKKKKINYDSFRLPEFSLAFNVKGKRVVPTEKTDFELTKKVLLENKRKHQGTIRERTMKMSRESRITIHDGNFHTHPINLKSKKKVADNFLLRENYFDLPSNLLKLHKPPF